MTDISVSQTNIVTTLKFCVDCKWMRWRFFAPNVCVHPQVNVSNERYLVTGMPTDAKLARHARIERHCNFEGQLYEPHEEPR